VKYEDFDADTEKSKKVAQNFLVGANDVKEAYERMKESLSTLMVDFQIPSIIESPLVDIFPYTEDLDREIERPPIEEVEEEHNLSGSGPVYSASGEDEDEDEDLDTEETQESEIEDELED
jgi:hypothetical protein